MRSKRKNKAIQGRRNRQHQFGPIFQVDSYDMELKKSLMEVLNKFPNGWDYLVIPKQVNVIFSPYAKKPRVICKTSF